MPDAVKPRNTQFSMCRRAPLKNTTPEVPDALTPSKMRPRKLIKSLAPALTTMPLVPGEGIVPATPTASPSDADRLGDGHRAEVARIEDVDLAAGVGLGQRRGEGQAGRHAGAWIGIAAQRRRDEGLRRGPAAAG